MKTKKVEESPAPADPFTPHRDARRRLTFQLPGEIPELERVLSAKTLTTTQAEETTDFDELDKLSIRLRSLEIREKVSSQKSAESEKCMQSTLAVHIERDEGLAAYLDERLLHEALAQLRKHFPSTFAEEALLQDLAPKTLTYLDGRIHAPQARPPHPSPDSSSLT